ncbi:protein phosphatase 1 regulatory subunit 3F isoform X2 [Mugil cephalus]|uniref:protein phosphatase 1 regulatory subunit 3F isoform X2 n=1 Tax=Mugil cephalus TaxID=48193 RepID=UPI001FB6F749|nr:protein phosphatase 1 regulatory subunit 3F isoform X2 [Mugil cephalus]
MSFLTIPSQEGLFTTVKAGKSAGGSESRSPMDAEDNNNDDDDDEEDDSENVRLIPRCSPVPRKRGSSIYDETAEYMRIHLALSAGKRVSFADTTGGDLVDVKEFVAFDSDDEADSAKWEEEEAKYRKPKREPTYRVYPEFTVRTASALLEAVHNNKVEVEQMSPVENEPLALSGIVRVLNISFHKAVYIRSTMDSWVTYFDHPAEYIQGSHDGDTDQFSFKLSFAPPYITHGSRIEFVVRYETSNGDYWANNSSMNYVVTLLLSHEDDAPQANIDAQQIRSILKPPKAYRSGDGQEEEEEEEEEEEVEAGASSSRLVRPIPVCPVIIQPEIDIEIADHPSGSSVPSNQELPSVDGTLSSHTMSPGEMFPCISSETPLKSNSAQPLCASESVQPDKRQPLPRLHCELGNQMSEQPTDSTPAALLPAAAPSLEQEPEPRPDNSLAVREEIPPSEEPRMCLLTTETQEDASTENPASRPCLELPSKCVSSPSVTQGSEQEVVVGLSERDEGFSEDADMSTAQQEGSTPVNLCLVAESLGAEGEAPPSPELTEVPSASAGGDEGSQNPTPQSVSARKETGCAPHISPDTLLENEQNTLSEVFEPQSEHVVNRNLMPSFIFLSGVVSLSIVLQEPGALFLIGLLLVLRRL